MAPRGNTAAAKLTSWFGGDDTASRATPNNEPPKPMKFREWVWQFHWKAFFAWMLIWTYMAKPAIFFLKGMDEETERKNTEIRRKKWEEQKKEREEKKRLSKELESRV
eukprot:PhF_6_TR30844/c0_g1_i1/m.45393